jgi:hypothetical protein
MNGHIGSPQQTFFEAKGGFAEAAIGPHKRLIVSGEY